jgi:energy-coupling factor transport system ATP-binding protein
VSVRVAGLSVRYPGRPEPSLRDVSLDIGRGQRIGLTGRTGAGKSTLALAAAGFIPRVVRGTLTGEASVDGRTVVGTDAADVLGRVGIVFSTPANQLSGSKSTVREELAFGLENLGGLRESMDGRIEAVMARLGIRHLADREPFSLSSGEQQRVAIASIVVMGTGALVLDEPTAQLDPAGTTAVAELLRELAGTGSSILVTSHDPGLLAGTDRCHVLDQGAVTASGPSAGVVADYRAAIARDAEASLARGPIWTPVTDRRGARLEVVSVGYRYPAGVEALRGVRLTIEPGETVAIVGQNGSGKTTLVRHLVGLLRPTTGHILLDGEPTVATPTAELAATVGLIFQDPSAQLFERTVEREVGFGPRNLRLEAVDLHVGRALEAVGLADERATNPYDLDPSRRKLVALAGVLAMDPAILVIDEPTTGQDPDGVARVGRLVRAAAAAGRTVIAVTHDIAFAAASFGRIVVLRDGEVILDGPPAEVFDDANEGLLATTGLTFPGAV